MKTKTRKFLEMVSLLGAIATLVLTVAATWVNWGSYLFPDNWLIPIMIGQLFLFVPDLIIYKVYEPENKVWGIHRWKLELGCTISSAIILVSALL